MSPQMRFIKAVADSLSSISALYHWKALPEADQEKILALLAAWSFDRKPTAECGNFSIENVISITKKQALKAVSVF